MENNGERKNEEDELSGIIIRTSVKTVFFTAVFCALLLTLAVFLFPFQAMNFYMDVGNKVRALESADVYLAGAKDKDRPTYDSRYAGVLYTASDLAGSLFHAAVRADKKTYYAERTDELTERYFSVHNISMKNEAIDSFNLSSGVNPAAHPSLYSIADYMTVRQYDARVCLGKKDKLIWTRDRALDFDTLLNSTLNAENFAVTDETILPWITVFHQLSSYIDGVFREIGVYELPDLGDEALGTFGANLKGNHFDLFYSLGERKGFTKIYTLVTGKFKVFSDFVNAMPMSDAKSALKKCYCLKAISDFALKMDNLCYILYAQDYPVEVSVEASKTWRENDVYRYGPGEGEYYYMTNYYENTLLPSYIEFYNKEK